MYLIKSPSLFFYSGIDFDVELLSTSNHSSYSFTSSSAGFLSYYICCAGHLQERKPCTRWMDGWWVDIKAIFEKIIIRTRTSLYSISKLLLLLPFVGLHVISKDTRRRRGKNNGRASSHHQLINVIVKFTYIPFGAAFVARLFLSCVVASHSLARQLRTWTRGQQPGSRGKYYRCSTNSRIEKSSWLESNKTKRDPETRTTAAAAAHVPRLYMCFPLIFQRDSLSRALPKKRTDQLSSPGREGRAQ